MLKRFIILIGFISACSLTAADRPNTIFILCDDMGAGDIGVLWQNGREGKQRFSTPNLDQFAREGMILSRHFCPAPICAFSRGSLLTGRHQWHCAVRNTQFDKELPNEHTLGSVLQRAGYVTAGGVVFSSGSYDLKIKAFDVENSKELWAHKLPFYGTAPPSIYEARGKQYVVIPAIGGGKLRLQTGDAYVAFALPDNS